MNVDPEVVDAICFPLFQALHDERGMWRFRQAKATTDLDKKKKFIHRHGIKVKGFNKAGDKLNVFNAHTLDTELVVDGESRYFFTFTKDRVKQYMNTDTLPEKPCKDKQFEYGRFYGDRPRLWEVYITFLHKFEDNTDFDEGLLDFFPACILRSRFMLFYKSFCRFVGFPEDQCPVPAWTIKP